MNSKPYITSEEISAVPPSSNEKTELFRSLDEQLSSGGLIEFERNFFRFHEEYAMKNIYLRWAFLFFSNDMEGVSHVLV